MTYCLVVVKAVGVALGIGQAGYVAVCVPGLFGALVQTIYGFYRAAQDVVACECGVASGVRHADALTQGVPTKSPSKGLGVAHVAIGRLNDLGGATELVVPIRLLESRVLDAGDATRQGAALRPVNDLGCVAGGIHIPCATP